MKLNDKIVKPGGRLDKDILKMLEIYLDINFPRDYRKFLIEYNGGKTLHRTFFMKNSGESACLDRLFGFVANKHYSILEYYKAYKERIPFNTFPIGYDPFGNLILLSVKDADRGKIYFWDHEREADEGEVPDYSNLTLIADSFEEFINNLYAEEEI